MRSAVCLVLSVSFLVIGGDAGVAAPIIWGPAQTISGNGDVSTAGSLLSAYTIGASAVEVTPPPSTAHRRSHARESAIGQEIPHVDAVSSSCRQVWSRPPYR